MNDLDALVRAGDLTFDEGAALLRALDQSGKGKTQQLAVVRDGVKTYLAKRFPASIKTALVDGVGQLERSRAGAKTKWQGPELVRTLASRLADEALDVTTGEMMPPGVLAARVADVIIDVAGLDTASQTFRKGAITRYGLDPNEYHETSGGTLTVHFID